MTSRETLKRARDSLAIDRAIGAQSDALSGSLLAYETRPLQCAIRADASARHWALNALRERLVIDAQGWRLGA
jgi:hypothetical protein